MGGYDGERMVSSVEVFDPRMESWTMAEPMNFSRGYGATVVLGDHLLTIGGVEDQETIVESVCCFHFILSIHLLSIVLFAIPNMPSFLFVMNRLSIAVKVLVGL